MRFEGWEKKIDEYLQKCSKRRFKWGSMDCLIFASNACKIVCGVDPMAKKRESDPETIRGLYKTAEEAYILIKEYRRTVPAIMDAHFDRININFAQRGDVVLGKLDYGSTFGIIWGGQAVFKSHDLGLVRVPLNDKMKCWKVN